MHRFHGRGVRERENYVRFTQKVTSPKRNRKAHATLDNPQQNQFEIIIIYCNFHINELPDQRYSDPQLMGVKSSILLAAQ